MRQHFFWSPLNGRALFKSSTRDTTQGWFRLIGSRKASGAGWEGEAAGGTPALGLDGGFPAAPLKSGAQSNPSDASYPACVHEAVHILIRTSSHVSRRTLISNCLLNYNRLGAVWCFGYRYVFVFVFLS